MRVLAIGDLFDNIDGTGLFEVHRGASSDFVAHAENIKPAVVIIDAGDAAAAAVLRRLRSALPGALIVICGNEEDFGREAGTPRAADFQILLPPSARGALGAFLLMQVKLLVEADLITLDECRVLHIRRALARTNRNISAAARILGIRRTSLQRMLRKT